MKEKTIQHAPGSKLVESELDELLASMTEDGTLRVKSAIRAGLTSPVGSFRHLGDVGSVQSAHESEYERAV